MKISSLTRYGFLLLGAALPFSTFHCGALTLSLTEQGALTGFIVGGGGPVLITPLGTDHWTVTIQDPRIGNPTSPLSASLLPNPKPSTTSPLTTTSNS